MPSTECLCNIWLKSFNWFRRYSLNNLCYGRTGGQMTGQTDRRTARKHNASGHQGGRRHKRVGPVSLFSEMCNRQIPYWVDMQICWCTKQNSRYWKITNVTNSNQNIYLSSQVYLQNRNSMTVYKVQRQQTLYIFFIKNAPKLFFIR